MKYGMKKITLGYQVSYSSLNSSVYTHIVEEIMFYRIEVEECDYLFEDQLNAPSLNRKIWNTNGRAYADIIILKRDFRISGMISLNSTRSNFYSNEEIKEIVNSQPLIILKNDRWEIKQADNLFDKYKNVWTIPVVNEDGKFIYAYVRVFDYIEPFKELNYDQADYELFCMRLRNFVSELCRKDPLHQYRVITDITYYYDIPQSVLSDLNIIWNTGELTDKNEKLVLAFLFDFNCINILPEILEKKIKFTTFDFAVRDMVKFPVRFFKTDAVARNVLIKEARRNSNYFDLGDFENIMQCIDMTREWEGDYLEIGTYKGDSARVALSYMKEKEIKRKSWFVDTFSGFDYDIARKSADSIWMDSHGDTSMQYVDEQLKEFDNYNLVRGNVITGDILNEINAIAICNIDVDLYEAVEAALCRVKDRIVNGGVILAEDYGHTPHLFGAQYAIRKFYEENRKIFYGIYLQSGQFLLIRK